MRKSVITAVILCMTLFVWLMAGCSDDTNTPNDPVNNPTGSGRIVVNLIDAPGDYEEVNIEFIQVDVRVAEDDTTQGWHTIAVDTTRANPGRIVVNLIDAPGDYEEVNIEFIQVDVRVAEDDTTQGWHTIAVDTTRANLLELTDGNYTVLADSTVPVGNYTEVRLLLSENNTVKVDGQLHELKVPSGYTSGLKLKHSFEITSGIVYSVTIDFDADRSIVETGNGGYKLKPVLRMTVDAVSGGILGQVLPVDARAHIMTTTFAGDTVVAWADTLDGDFMFPVLPLHVPGAAEW